MGVRRLIAEEGRHCVPARKGELFEHWVGNEIIKFIHASAKKPKLYFWRDPDGPEIDWLLEYNDALLPIEVKLSPNPKTNAAKHLKLFMHEYKNAKSSLVVCTTAIKFKLEKNTDVISYKELHDYLSEWLFKVK
jgi:predicted AAA+ superfamily ATPase